MIYDDKISNLIPKSTHDLKNWKPILWNLHNAHDLEAFQEVLVSEKPIITNEIRDQIKELVKCNSPRLRLEGDALEQAIDNHIGYEDIDTYGVWAYYPWSNRLVHILDENEFVKVRTNRNHYKISPAEEELLATKKVGLIGLSVGQSVAITMAMERGFGELRLADFDDLELTNLNRIRTGVHNLGLSKVISVAREIMEIDPFLSLKCFTEGITEDNIDQFFEEDGTLDLLIDECDGLDIKVICRYKARGLGIPVVMEASDRGLVDVERFDLEPERPILHGMVGDLDPDKLKTLKTNEDKIPYMLAIVGADTISTRAKASMLEIGETINTWPQLASAVTLGGGITADVVRRIFTGSYTESGRYYMDVESIIGNKNGTPEKAVKEKEIANASTPDFGPEPKDTGGAPIAGAIIKKIGEAACHAPSGGNLQPWRWSYANNTLQLKHDETLISSFLDHNYIASYVALGASLENAVLMAAHQGLRAETTYFPNPERKDITASIIFQKENDLEKDDLLLGKHIFDRETNRNLENAKELTPEHKDFLKSIASKNGSELVLIDDADAKKAISDVIAFAERFRILHPMGHKNFIDEIRWTKEEAEATRDGIDMRTVDLTVGEFTGFKLATHRPVIDKIVEWDGGSAFEKLSRKSTDTAGAIGIITRPEHSALDFVKAGRDMERVWIGANAHQIGFQPQSPISLILQRLEEKADLNTKQADQLNLASQKLQDALMPYTNGRPVFLFRLFYSNKPVVKSLRRPNSQHFQVL